jgi:hypothetical protein
MVMGASCEPALELILTLRMRFARFDVRLNRQVHPTKQLGIVPCMLHRQRAHFARRASA